MDNVAVDMSKKVDLSKKLETREDFGRVQYLSMAPADGPPHHRYL